MIATIKKKHTVYWLLLGMINIAVVFSILICGEIAYRIWLYRFLPNCFSESVRLPAEIGVMDRSPWAFDVRYGYHYVPGSYWVFGIRNQSFIGCSECARINPLGQSGSNNPDYQNAELKVAMFGDSMMGMALKHGERFDTIALALQERLQKLTGKKVAVLNFGCDGYGVLQMFDLARDKVSEWRPDIVVFGFITDDLTRARFWRTPGRFGGEDRVLTTIDPNPNPPPTRATDTGLVNIKAGKENCARALNDPTFAKALSSEFVEQYRRIMKKNTDTRPSIFDFTHSILYSRLKYGDPFRTFFGYYRPTQGPRHQLNDFGEDTRFTESVARLRTFNIPTIIVHFAIYPEIIAGKEYDLALKQQMQSLLHSLQQRTGTEIYETLGNVALPSDLKVINLSPDNYHPSITGMDFYAELIANILQKKGLIKQKP